VEIDRLLRVSAAAVCRVIFPHPHTSATQLVLERRITHGETANRVLAQPFGGALRILDPDGLRAAVGNFTYDSIRSSDEQDLRILIQPNDWEMVKGFILAQMQSKQPDVIETDPCRELEEEFVESVGIRLLPEHYTYRPVGISVQDRPTPTTNPRLPGASTTRIYRVFEVAILDASVCGAVLKKSQRYTDEDLLALAEALAAHEGKGRVNGALVIPFEDVRNAYQRSSPHSSFQPLSIHGHTLDSSTAVLFEDLHDT